MGSGKSSWAISTLFNETQEESILYIGPTLDEDNRIIEQSQRKFYTPENRGGGKLGNISGLLNSGVDIASTHELFRRFDKRCKEALFKNKYILVLDETISAVEPYHFTKKDDFPYLLTKNDVRVNDDGLVEWIGSDLDTRFDDVRLLAKNKCLFRVDDKFFLWHYPCDIFSLFDQVFILTYNFDGSLMAPYFKLYNISYNVKSVKEVNGKYCLCDYFPPKKSLFRDRIKVYEGNLNTNIGSKENVLSSTWSKSKYYSSNRKTLKNNFSNFSRHIVGAKGNEILWTCFKSAKSELQGKGYSKRFLACNARATNDYQDATCLMYGANIYKHPEIIKFFAQHGITVDQDALALNTLLQWVWRSNIRVKDSTKIINVYIPSERMRKLFNQWLNS